jgi:hypothetical protein
MAMCTHNLVHLEAIVPKGTNQVVESHYTLHRIRARVLGETTILPITTSYNTGLLAQFRDKGAHYRLTYDIVWTSTSRVRVCVLQFTAVWIR